MSSDRGRTVASLVLVVLGAILLVLGALALYARTAIIDEDAFADRAETALEDDDVRQLVGEQIVVKLIDRGSTDLIAARPVLETVVDQVLNAPQFERLFRESARQANRVLFDRDSDNVALKLSDAVGVVRFALQSVAPKLADSLPKGLDVALLKLKERDFARQTLAVADTIRTLGWVLPVVALIALIAAAFVAPDRRTGVMRAAIAVGAAGTLLAIVLLIVEARLLAGVVGEDEVTDEAARAAIAGVLDAFFGGLLGWAVALAFGGVVVAAAAAVLDPDRAEDPVARVRRRLAQRPESRAWRGLRAGGALVLGVLVVLEPALALQIAAVLAGAYLAFFGTSELLLLLERRDVTRAEGARVRRRSLVQGGIAAAVVVIVGVVVVLVVTSGEDQGDEGAVGSVGECNGSAELCGLRLNEVVFAGTHNSFSAADSPGWFIANQRRTIPRQLKDGIRLMLIDAHWGVEAGNGRVRTDFEAEGRDRNRVAAAMPPAVLAAAERLAGNLGLGDKKGDPEVYLCHTACEIGATKMVDAMNDVREFLEANPGEVVILFVEPYVPPEDVATVLDEAGLKDYLLPLDRAAPLPTLGQLVKSGRRLVVFAEKDADGDPPWYLDGFSFVQDTPLGAKEVDQLKCTLFRGTAQSPLLMLNHWADVFPPRLRANRPFGEREVLVRRAHRCARERGLPVNLIATDHYDQGALIEAVEVLNRERVEAARRRGTVAGAATP